jgi:hypothetical protein
MEFENWTVTGPAPSKNMKTYWTCRCNKCGTEKAVRAGNLTNELTRSCGCVTGEKGDYHVPRRVGKLFVMGWITAEESDTGKGYWSCICSCSRSKGHTVWVRALTSELRRGSRISCGCTQIRKRLTVSNTPGYQSWKDMKARCNNPNHQHYKDYGGRGITYPHEWRDFKIFRLVMGPCPEGMSLDRLAPINPQ